MKFQTKHHSYKIGTLADGCKQCVLGRKLVLFITGLCHYKCYYCPISEKRRNKDVVYANERPCYSIKEVIEEAKLSRSHGAGITGGDPLVVTDRCCEYIKALKKHFGKEFHIHLYTPLDLVNKERLEKLYKAGLDEIRFHLYLDRKKELWPRLNLALDYDWDIGVEIPAIPGMKKETIEMIEFIKDKVAFLNLNELEISEMNAKDLTDRNYFVKDKISYAIKGSRNLALDLLKYCNKNTKLRVHFCTSKLKDGVQLVNRVKLRGKIIAKDHDILTNEGSLIRGVVYLKELAPGLDYKKKFMEIKDKSIIIKKLNDLKAKLQKLTGIESRFIEIDKNKLRILIAPWILEETIKGVKKLNAVPAIIEEFPTYDMNELDLQILS